MTDPSDIIRRGMAALAHVTKFEKIQCFEPYLKQQEFFAAGATYDDRAFIAANQVGKTTTGGFEDAVHLTGLYPADWPGHKFKQPPIGWIAGPKADKVRDTTQKMLYGPWDKPSEFGTGFLPRDAIIGRPTLARGVSGAYDTGSVRWVDGRGRLDESAISTVSFKAYTEGKLAFASETIDFCHEDEEEENGKMLELHSEIRVRLQARSGISYATLTPLLGNTPFILWYKGADAHGHCTIMGIFDACRGHDPRRPYLGHYDREQAERIITNYPQHERDARAYGVPQLGEGRIFLTPSTNLLIPQFEPPPLMAKLWGSDLGGVGSGSHPFAACLVGLDPEFDVLYLLHTIRMQGMTRYQHIPAIRRICAMAPVAWPHDGNEMRENAAGATESIAQSYKNPMEGMPGLLMLPEHATWPEGGYAVSTAIEELDARCQTGRFKVLDTPENAMFLAEYDQYHRKDGVIVKKFDDCLSALFKALMMKRYAKAVPLGPGPKFTRPTTRGSYDAPPVDIFTNQPIA